MEIEHLDQIIVTNSVKQDTLDIPDCFGEFDKKAKLCSKYCAISIRCCVLYNKNPKIDIMEKLFFHNYYSIKLQ